MLKPILSIALVVSTLSPSVLSKLSDMQLTNTSNAWYEYVAINRNNSHLIYRTSVPDKGWNNYDLNIPTLLQGTDYEYYIRYSNGTHSVLEETDMEPTEFYVSENATLDEYVQRYLELNTISKDCIGIYYIDLTSGEEYSFNGEQLWVAASTWKLGLGIAIEDQLNKGNLTKKSGIYYTPEFDVGGTQYVTGYYPHYSYIKVEDLMYKMLVPSGNVSAALLWSKLDQLTHNNLQTYMDLVDAGEVEYERSTNQITPKFQTYLMRKLYENQQAYGYTIWLLKQAYTNTYSRTYVKNRKGVELLHKCGFYDDYINDVVLNLGEHPYALAIYTSHIANPKEHIGKLTSIVTDYTTLKYTHE